MRSALTFRSQGLCVDVEDSSQQSHFLQDDTKAVDVSFLSPTWRRTLCPQQLWGRPQLTCKTPGGGAQVVPSKLKRLNPLITDVDGAAEEEL